MKKFIQHIKEGLHFYVPFTVSVILFIILGFTALEVVQQQDVIEKKQEKIESLKSMHIRKSNQLSKKEKRIEELKNRLDTANKAGQMMTDFGVKLEDILIRYDEIVGEYDRLVREYCYTYRKDSFRYQYNKLTERYVELMGEYKKARKRLKNLVQ